MPFYGTGCGPVDDYLIRSSMCPLFRIGVGRPMTDSEAVRLLRHVEQFRRIEPYLVGDFYPLTACTLAKDAWVAWQYDRPDLGQGVVQAFRRAECPVETVRLKLSGLDADAKYTVTNLDESATSRALGVDLMRNGLAVSTEVRPHALLITYQRQP
jgi:alpha-galactosidase